MAVVSSHILDAFDGSHAGGIPARLTNLSTSDVLAESETDSGGRVSLLIDLSSANPSDRYELTFLSGRYWKSRMDTCDNVVDEVVLRFQMPDQAAKYHMPIILSPHGYSTWKSVPEKMDG